MMMRKFEAINNVVIGYIGNIYSRGSSQEDEKALNGLRITMELVDHQLNGIIDEYQSTARCFEGSRIVSHKECESYLKELRGRIEDILND